jgi:hypothetical protein
MISYHLYIVLSICLGFSAGNLLFYGIAQDQILINHVKRSIQKKKVLNQKINEHNLKVADYCFSGQKSLIRHHKEQMSLQKI